ncbi:hypothetical protein [Oceanirhabdus sp. W0125-5]|uniref:hypothetical protein n=1 Tax=Oceanirhabdus sp. W0125-5 TaxID=2999116 RepID=UPI0022F30690|nr:hypothetical protein [Oceanirhabdus sp. W0125-5]WBW98725.1 hypothetical protein OW730_08195 [Oceanirhabdus sp. W0125-5]
MEFLGYDYAYPGALYYSSIYHELSVVNELCIDNKLNGFKLNKYGLFNTYDELLKFMEMRENLKVKYPYTFELGDFVVYKVWRYIKNKKM